MRLWHWPAALATGFILCHPASLRAEEPAAEGPFALDIAAREKARKLRAEALADRKEKFEQLDATLKKERETADKVSKYGSATMVKILEAKTGADELPNVQDAGDHKVIIDGKEFVVSEPRSMEQALGFPEGKKVQDEYEISPEDFEMYSQDRWTLTQTDFKFDAPQYITASRTAGQPKTWFGFTFSVTNSTPKKRRISPTFVAWTNKGAFNHAVGGFVPEQVFSDSLMRPSIESNRLKDKEWMKQGIAPLESSVQLSNYTYDGESAAAKLSPLMTFEPGQTRWGAALWSGFNNEFTELKIAIHGLSNAHRYDKKLRRVLVLTFERPDDEFHVHRTPLKYKNKQWEFSWMWDQDITVPPPADAADHQIKVKELDTPAGGKKLAWAFPFLLKNSTPTGQEIAITSVSYALPIEVDVGGTKTWVEVKVVDDGRSTIYKSQLLQGLGKPSTKDRFQVTPIAEGSFTLQQRRKVALEAGKGLEEIWAAFDEADVDWTDAIHQVEAALTEKADKKALAKTYWEQLVKTHGGGNAELAAKDPGIFYDPRRRLTEDETKAVKEQIIKGLTGALDKAKGEKTVTAYFDATSGLSTGTYRISRSYKQPGVVEEAWLKAFEELDK